jgi:hypothetical protein
MRYSIFDSFTAEDAEEEQEQEQTNTSPHLLRKLVFLKLINRLSSAS